MLRYLPVAGLIAFVLEISSLVWMGGRLGLGLTLLLLLADVIVGFSLFRLAGAGMAQILRMPMQDRQLGGILASAAISRAIAGLLFIVPGFFSDLIAILVLLPVVRKWLSARMTVSAMGGMPGETSNRSPRTGTIIIEGDAVEIIEERPVLPPREPGRD